MKYRRFLILLLLTLFFGALGWWLTLSESSPFNRLLSDSHTAQVQYLVGVVERQTAGSEEWIRVSVGDTLNPKDHIRTSSNSNVLLTFSGEASLFLGSDSEVEFASGLYLWNGELSYKRMKGSKTVPSDINTADGTLSMGSRLPGDIEEVWVTRSVRGTHVAIDHGSGAWSTANGESKALMQGDYLQFESVSVMRQDPIIRSPEAGEVFTHGYLSRGFNVVWTPDSSATSYRIEITKIDEGASYMTWNDTETNAFRVRNLDAGIYSVRVWSFGADGRRSQWSQTQGFSISGRYFGSLNAPLAWEEPIRFDVAPYRENLLLGGWLRKDLIDTHEIVFYALTDAWWIQPSVEEYRISANEDGYFESFCNSARSVYVMVVAKGEGDFPETVPRSRYLPFPDGKYILYHIEKTLRP